MGDLESVNLAFSRQSSRFDEDDRSNPILLDLREQVYRHVDRFLSPSSKILEINAGTGIDAIRFVQSGHRVHATDLSDGMIAQIRTKMRHFSTDGRLTVQQLSYDRLAEAEGDDYDMVFSNFGGLNCTDDLQAITGSLAKLLKPSAFVTWVVMPPVSAWELAGALKFKRRAFRRWSANGTMAHIEGVHFRTWYHALSTIKEAFGPRFKLRAVEGLAAISPPPDKVEFVKGHPVSYRWLRNIDRIVNRHFPFDRCADHMIVTFQYDGQ